MPMKMPSRRPRLTAERALSLVRGRLPVRPTRKRPLTLEGVLGWADAHRARTGDWPRSKSGPVKEADGETWRRVDQALRLGTRGLAGGSSLARLLAERRGVRNPIDPPPLSEGQILAWARAHEARTGKRPNAASGPVAGVPGESWGGINQALTRGLRGLPVGSSLAKFLRGQYKRSGNPNRGRRPASQATA
jgi:hypothetical protein